MKKTQPAVPISRGLLWAAFFILVVGGSITYLLSLEEVDPAARIGMMVTAMLTVIATGICVICATANWWLYR